MLISTSLELKKDGVVDKVVSPESSYNPSDTAKQRMMMIREDFRVSHVVLTKPRREFNEMSVLERASIDTMSWAVFQPNDGDPAEGDIVNGWRSNAIRPVIRNKVTSIAAHVTARTLFPKVVAFDHFSQEQEDAAQVMSDLIEYTTVCNNSSFADVSLHAVIAALVQPVSWVYTEYAQVYRDQKVKQEDGSYKVIQVLDEDLSGYQDESVPTEQVYIQNFFEADAQRQPTIIRRRIRPYALLKAIYGSKYDDFVHVKPGIQMIYNDANQTFYDVYDKEMQPDECEEILYWNKSLDLFQIAINGVLLTDPENPNPREDKLYPWVSFGYELLRPNGDCAFYKSLAFKGAPDEKIINTLYPMIIDGTYLSIMPPMIALGGETIETDVIVPGGVTVFSDPEADLKPLLVQAENLKAGFDALFKVEENISHDSIDDVMNGEGGQGEQTAYEMKKREEAAQRMLGLFVQMVGRYVKQMGRLRIGDIKQYMTLAEVAAIEGSADADLVYKTFVMPHGPNRKSAKRIKFTLDTPDEELDEAGHLAASYDVLKEQGGEHAKATLAKVNPVLFRQLKYLVMVTPDVIAPLSDDLERAYNLELYDRLIADPMADHEAALSKVLLPSYPVSKRHPDEFVAKQPQNTPGAMPGPLAPQPQQQSSPIKKPTPNGPRNAISTPGNSPTRVL